MKMRRPPNRTRTSWTWGLFKLMVKTLKDTYYNKEAKGRQSQINYLIFDASGNRLAFGEVRPSHWGPWCCGNELGGTNDTMNNGTDAGELSIGDSDDDDDDPRHRQSQIAALQDLLDKYGGGGNATALFDDEPERGTSQNGSASVSSSTTASSSTPVQIALPFKVPTGVVEIH